MRRSLIFAAFALGAQAAWAQDATEPVVTGPVVVEETAETAEVAGETEADTAIVEVVADETHLEETDPNVADEADPGIVDDTAEPPIETAEEEPTAEVTVGDGTDDGEASVEADSVPVHADNRSATGARGGHHGTVSTLARAGLGPVFGKLRSQGYGDIQIEQVGDVIFVSGARDGEIRQLSYSASTGTLLEDTGQPRGLLEAIAGKLKGEPAADKARGKHKSSAKSDGSKNGGKGRSRKGAQGGGKSKSGGGSKAGGSKDGGNGGNGKGGGGRKK